jgi:hypothetical protein
MDKELYVKFLDSKFRAIIILIFYKVFYLISLPIVVLLRRFGFLVIPPFGHKEKYLLSSYKYPTYDNYKDIQVKANKKKLQRVGTTHENLRIICNYAKRLDLPKHNFIKMVCHGSRNGFELIKFKEFIPTLDVIGTDISETALTFENTILWDFNQVNPAWISYFDLIYSNSLDHSFNLKKTLNVWIESLKGGGYLILEISSATSTYSKSDPTSIHVEVFPWLIFTWFKNDLSVVNIFELPESQNLGFPHFAIILKKKANH